LKSRFKLHKSNLLATIEGNSEKTLYNTAAVGICEADKLFPSLCITVTLDEKFLLGRTF
jgi:hypothetical protein